MYSREEILDRIYKVAKNNLEHFDINKKLTENLKLLEDLNLDSLDKIEIWMGIEEEFIVDIPDYEVKELVTVGDMVNLVIKYLEIKK